MVVPTRPSQVTGHGQSGAKYYPDGIPGYEEIGNTAYITFDIFSMSTTDLDDYYQEEDLASFGDDDTFALLMKAHKQIHRENSPIENVVVDLSCNAGGDADCAIFLIAWFLGEAAIGTKDCMTGAMCTSTYRCDASRDRKFDEGDTVTDKNLFCLISPFSFSCANLVPCMFKESGRVTLSGRASGGGACNVQPTRRPGAPRSRSRLLGACPSLRTAPSMTSTEAQTPTLCSPSRISSMIVRP